MAEALAVVGIVANIVQLVDFGSRVLKRLEEYQSKLGEIPEVFRHIKAELPKAAIDAGCMQDETKKALLPAIEGCGVQIKSLDDVIVKALPVSGDSWARRGRKALGSLRYDAKAEKITAVVRGYIQTLTYHAAASSTLRPLADRTLPRLAPSSTVPFRRDPHFVDREILQGPGDFLTTVETRLGNDGLSTNRLSQDIQNLIYNNQVTRTQVDYIQRKLNLAQETWRNAFSSISNFSNPGLEKSAVLDLINGKINNLNTVQRALNNLYGTV